MEADEKPVSTAHSSVFCSRLVQAGVLSASSMDDEESLPVKAAVAVAGVGAVVASISSSVVASAITMAIAITTITVKARFSSFQFSLGVLGFSVTLATVVTIAAAVSVAVATIVSTNMSVSTAVSTISVEARFSISQVSNLDFLGFGVTLATVVSVSTTVVAISVGTVTIAMAVTVTVTMAITMTIADAGLRFGQVSNLGFLGFSVTLPAVSTMPISATAVTAMSVSVSDVSIAMAMAIVAPGLSDSLVFLSFFGGSEGAKAGNGEQGDSDLHLGLNSGVLSTSSKLRRLGRKF